MRSDLEAEAAAMRAAMEQAVHLMGCGHADDARHLLSAYLAGVDTGRELLRAYERDSERASRCLRDHVGPALKAFMRSETPGGWRSAGTGDNRPAGQ